MKIVPVETAYVQYPPELLELQLLNVHTRIDRIPFPSFYDEWLENPNA